MPSMAPQPAYARALADRTALLADRAGEPALRTVLGEDDYARLRARNGGRDLDALLSIEDWEALLVRTAATGDRSVLAHLLEARAVLGRTGRRA